MPTNMTTLAEVSDRVDALNQKCNDALVDVPAISFESLNTMKIGDERHTLQTVAQRSIAWRLGIPYNYLAKCPVDLQADQMNHWIKHEKWEQLFVGLMVRRFERYSLRDINRWTTSRLQPAWMKWDTRLTPRFNFTMMPSLCCYRFRTAEGSSKSTGAR
jgi:hypothetical protein